MFYMVVVQVYGTSVAIVVNSVDVRTKSGRVLLLCSI